MNGLSNTMHAIHCFFRHWVKCHCMLLMFYYYSANILYVSASAKVFLCIIIVSFCLVTCSYVLQHWWIVIAGCTFHLVTDSQCFLRLIFLIMLCVQKIILILIFLRNRVQRKSFLQFAIWASRTSFQLAPQTFWKAELISQFFSYSNSSKDITHLLGKLKTEFTCPIAKSPSPGLLDTTFFARCITLPTWCSLKCVISVYNVEGNVVDYHPVQMKNPSTSFYISVVWVPCSSWTSSSFKFFKFIFQYF